MGNQNRSQNVQKYKLKEGCRIEHDNQKYGPGDVLELNPELALFHASNIEVVKAEKVAASKVAIAKEDAQ
jgi:hypothetical protein